MIDLLPDEAQQALADSFAQVLAAEAPLARLHQADARDDRLLAALAELGWLGLGIAPEHGGIGGGAVEEVLLMREAGRALVSPCLAAAMLAARLAEPESAAAVIAGHRLAAIAFDRYRIDGTEAALTVYLGSEGASLVTLADAVPIRAIDDSVTLERIRVAPPASEDGAALRRFTLWAGAVLAGMAEVARDMAVAYAKVREQFGQPIGGFQAIKHRCADMALRCEAAWTQVAFAALAEDGERSDAQFQIAAARLIAGDAALSNARANVQVHGGIGFTEECDAHLLVRRAQLWLAMSGGERRHQRDILAAPSPAEARG